MTLFRTKPWEFKGRRMERNAPRGYRCDENCSHRVPSGSQALCTVCHEVFGGVGMFDRHRSDGWCRNPAEMGLRLTERRVWSAPMDRAALNRLRSDA